MTNVLRSLSTALVACYHWSQTRPQALGYGGILLFGAFYGAGDAIMFFVAAAVILGWVIGVWRYVMRGD